MAENTADAFGGPSVLVVGGGLAGLATACGLADQGHRVTVVEKRPFVGGRAYSFTDPETGAEVDNGQHVFLGCCTALIAFFRKLGVLDRAYLQPRPRIPIRDRAGRTAWVSAAPLPPPAHLLPSLVRYRHLSWADRMRLLRGALAILRTDRADPALDQVAFSDWLRAHGQSEQAIARFWDLVVLPALNEHAGRASARLALMVFQEGMLRARASASVGYARVGLSDLFAQAAVRYIQERGGIVLTGQSVTGLHLAEGRVRGALLSDGTPLRSDVYVLAPHAVHLSALLPEALRADPFFARVQQLSTAPVVGVHVWYDRPVADLEFAAFVDSEVQWLFNKTRIYGRDEAAGQYLCISLSGARDYVDMPKEDLRRRFLAELAGLFPRAREAQVVRFVVVRERHATVAPAPDAQRHRPPQRTPVPNLFLAGSWTDTGWPDTMESAVRSADLCVRAIRQAARGAYPERAAVPAPLAPP